CSGCARFGAAVRRIQPRGSASSDSRRPFCRPRESCIPGQKHAFSSNTRGGSRVPKSGLLGFVRGARSNARPYRDLPSWRLKSPPSVLVRFCAALFDRDRVGAGTREGKRRPRNLRQLSGAVDAEDRDRVGERITDVQEVSRRVDRYRGRASARSELDWGARCERCQPSAGADRETDHLSVGGVRSIEQLTRGIDREVPEPSAGGKASRERRTAVQGGQRPAGADLIAGHGSVDGRRARDANVRDIHEPIKRINGYPGRSITGGQLRRDRGQETGGRIDPEAGEAIRRAELVGRKHVQILWVDGHTARSAARI